MKILLLLLLLFSLPAQASIGGVILHEGTGQVERSEDGSEVVTEKELNIFSDDGYRKEEVTERKRFNINSTYKSKKIEGLSYGVNGNFLFQTTGSAIIWKIQRHEWD